MVGWKLGCNEGSSVGMLVGPHDGVTGDGAEVGERDESNVGVHEGKYNVGE